MIKPATPGSAQVVLEGGLRWVPLDNVHIT